MRTVFIDTLYWVTVINPQDQWHARAVEVKTALGAFRGVTTEAVLIEVANYFCAAGKHGRATVVGVIQDILDDPDLETIPTLRDTFLSGLALYEARLDKGYSLTDCISMNAMRERGLTEVLTHDKHFAQEGFSLLL